MTARAAEKPCMVIGSRGSELALWQARHIASLLSELGIATRIEIIKTTGDHLQTASLVQAGGKGLFTKEIEEALLAGGIDLAVHSLKDLPVEQRSGLTVAAISEREDARDVLLGKGLNDLQEGARVGTSSGRRAAQLLVLRPDLRIEPIRGNVDTRVRKLKEGQYDAIVLAAAGLRRLGFEQEIAYTFSPDEICPAAGQGALALETRMNDGAAEVCARLNHQPTCDAVRCERAVLAALGGGCQLPVGAYAEVVDQTVDVRAVVLSPDGGLRLRATCSGERSNAEKLGQELGVELLSRGAAELLEASK